MSVAPGAFAHPHDDGVIVVAQAQVPVPTVSAAPIVSGQGAFRYEYVPGKLELPAGVRVKNANGLCHDPDGFIYFTYEPEKVDATTRVLVRFAADGTGATLLGADNKLAAGTPHGLTIHTGKDGKSVLYHCNNGATVTKTALDGTILWSQTWPAQMGNYKPTDATVAAGKEDVVFVADGYGSSMIHALRTKDGVYAGKSWGGAGTAHGEFRTPHGITFDSRKNLLLVADRENNRLEYYTTAGVYQSTLAFKELTRPVNTDVWGDYLLVPSLDGNVGVLDKDNKLISLVEVGKLLVAQGSKHPHDAIWLANGDIVVCTWNPGRLSYWRRLPAEPSP